MVALLSLFVGLRPYLFDPPAQEPPPRPVDTPGAFLFEEGTIHDIELTLTDEARGQLGRNQPDVHATLVYEGVRLDVGLKLKGSSTYRGIDGKPSFKIDIGQWVDKQDLLGVRRITLNSMLFDPTMMREHAAYRLYAEVGVPAPRHGYARVTVNGEPYGLYGIVETMDERFLRRRFPQDSEGNLYDSTFTYADLTPLGVGSFELKEGKPLEPYADLAQLVGELDRGNILDVLDARFDRDEVLGMWAVDLVSGNWDGYSRNTNNYLLYHETTVDRWHFVPWGQDYAFQGGGGVYLGVVGRMVAACVADVDCRALLDDRVITALDAWEGGDLLGYAEATWATIGADCEADPRKARGCDPDHLFRALRDRPGPLRDEIP